MAGHFACPKTIKVKTFQKVRIIVFQHSSLHVNMQEICSINFHISNTIQLHCETGVIVLAFIIIEAETQS